MAAEVEDDDHDDRLIGEILASRYQIESRLGEGAMGAVYRARHVKVGRAFAVKILHPHLLMDNKVLHRFEREAELAGRLRHANVIGVVDVGETPDGLHYMVMDFAEGPDLATLLGEAPMPPQRVIHLTRQLLEGLFHAHEHGLIHRDFKPENVIVERDSHGVEVPRIVDFGIAILREGGDSADGPGRITTNGLVLGTPHYMAPEQAVADPIDHRIDLFALGIIIYEMLSGRLPFDGTGAEVARANLLLDPPLIAERVPYLEVDPLLEAFARRLMAKKRDLRPPTAKAARDLLDLIDHDRAAAATALGVPLAVAGRTPMVTQPVAPQRATSHPGTFPPPVREAPARNNQQQHLTTEVVREPLPYGHKRRRGLLVVGGVAVLGLGIAGAVLLLGGNQPDDADHPVVVEATPRSAVAPPPPTPPTPPTTQPEVAPPPTQPEVATPPVEHKAPPTVAHHPRHDIKHTEVKPPEVKPPEVKPPEVKPPEVKPPEVKPPEVKPIEVVTPTEPKVVDVKSIAAQYKAVGAELKSLAIAIGNGPVSDLQDRYSLIRINEAMSSQSARDEASAILLKLHKEIAVRKSR